MRHTKEDNLIWESFNRGKVISAMAVKGDLIKLKGVPFSVNIDEIRVNSETNIVTIENERYPVTHEITKRLLSLGVEDSKGTSYEDMMSGRMDLSNLEDELEGGNRF